MLKQDRWDIVSKKILLAKTYTVLSLDIHVVLQDRPEMCYILLMYLLNTGNINCLCIRRARIGIPIFCTGNIPELRES